MRQFGGSGHCPRYVTWLSGPRSSGVERLLGKEKVTGSNLVVGSEVRPSVYSQCWQDEVLVILGLERKF